MKPPNVTFDERVATALADEPLRSALDRVTGYLVQARSRAGAAYPLFEPMRDRARQIRAHVLSRLDEYLAEFADNVTALGGQVYWAPDAEAANRYILELARARGVQRIVKSKSMVSEEVGLNHVLEGAGLEVVESDLGEYILQLAGETPAHIVGPALHKTKEQVGQLFHDRLDVPLSNDPAQLNETAREKLRRVFLTAEMGISGVNFGVADTGSICLVTNEGNGRLTTTAPAIHVALMGMERLVPSLADLGVMLEVLARSATGQKLSVYTNLVTGPRRADEADGPDELHVVILDNGRSRVLASELAEILYCIRCGACLNICPVYRQIGGHAYGSVYSGPVGAVLTPALQGGGAWSDLPQASSLCGACRDVCPVRIDIPGLLLKLRAESVRPERSAPPLQAAVAPPAWLAWGLRLYRLAALRPWLFRAAGRFVGWLTRRLAQEGWVRRLPGPASGWTAHRDFRAFPAKSFTQRWQERQRQAVRD